MTLLEIAQTAARRLLLPTVSSVIGSTSNNVIFLQAMIDRAVDEIRDSYPWPELQTEYTFTLADGVASYALPGDYDSRLNETLWNRDQSWPLIGPIDSVGWQQYKSGLITSLPRQRFRVKGWGLKQFFIDPTPTSDEDGETLVYEYISTRARIPKTWVASTSWTGIRYCSYDGYIFDRGGTGAATTGSDNAPTPSDLTDGSITWTLYTGEYSTFVHDSDQTSIDANLIIDGAVWRYKLEHGLPYEDLRATALEQLEDAKTKLSGAGILSHRRSVAQPHAISIYNYPDGNY